MKVYQPRCMNNCQICQAKAPQMDRFRLLSQVYKISVVKHMNRLRRGRVAYECLFSFVELYFLISRFLGAGPCKKAAQVNI